MPEFNEQKEKENLEEVFQDFDIGNIKKEMEIENIFLSEKNILDMQKIQNGYITVEELINKTIQEFGE